MFEIYWEIFKATLDRELRYITNPWSIGKMQQNRVETAHYDLHYDLRTC